MMNRRTFLGTAAASVLASTSTSTMGAPAARKKLAIVTTEWRERSHAWHMGERFLVGYPMKGKWHQPPFEVVSAYIDQFPKGDLSRKRAEEFGFKIYPTVAETLRAGSDKLAVDAILIIGEHGDYKDNDIGQRMYPRYEFFKQTTDVFRKDGRVAPIFNDKHLSWKWEWAKEMVETSKELKIPFLAGSSLPQTWRMPAIDMPYGAEVEEVMCVATGRVDSYDFHALETIQCMAERRKGGETGVKSMQALRGEEVWKAYDGTLSEHALFRACLTRTQTLVQPEGFSHRYPTKDQIREMVKEPVAYRFEYNDGVKASMLLMNGLVGDFTFAAKLKGREEPLSTLFYLPPTPNVVYSAALMAKAEALFTTRVAPYPIERTLLTTGLVEAGMKSLAAGKKIDTPHLAIKYQGPKESQFASE